MVSIQICLAALLVVQYFLAALLVSADLGCSAGGKYTDLSFSAVGHYRSVLQHCR